MTYEPLRQSQSRTRALPSSRAWCRSSRSVSKSVRRVLRAAVRAFSIVLPQLQRDAAAFIFVLKATPIMFVLQELVP